MEIVFALIGSRVGQIAMAFVVGWTMAWWKTDAAWRETVAKERASIEAARQIERTRQEAAAREIAAEATRRLEEEQAATDDMRRQIDDLRKAEADAPKKDCPSCRVDDDFLGRLRKLDAAGKARAPRRSR